MPIDRRQFCQAAATTALTAAVFASLPPFARRALAADDKVSMVELMAPQPLPDLFLGSDKAQCVIVEYASMTCPHCAHFAEVTFPELKKQYIDTGKVRYVLREFPLDSLAAAAFMLTRCAGEKDPAKYYAMVDILFKKQLEWAVEKPIPPLMALSKQAGFTEETFNACLSNQQLLDGIEKERQVAIDKFKIHSTPTFFINGTRYEGAFEAKDMAKIIDPHLNGT